MLLRMSLENLDLVHVFHRRRRRHPDGVGGGDGMRLREEEGE